MQKIYITKFLIFLLSDEWQSKDEQFAKCLSDRGFVLKPVEEDGACLFRSISLQIYGDEDMHDVIRQNTMDYIVSFVKSSYSKFNNNFLFIV